MKEHYKKTIICKDRQNITRETKICKQERKKKKKKRANFKKGMDEKSNRKDSIIIVINKHKG